MITLRLFKSSQLLRCFDCLRDIYFRRIDEIMVVLKATFRPGWIHQRVNVL